MSVGRFLQQAAAGNAGGPVYVDDVFSTYLYTGTNATQAVVNGLDLAGEGGLIWTKARTSDPNELDHQLMDSEQGAFRYVLESNTTNARFDFGGSIVTPNSDGFTLSSASRVNQNGYPYASWSFRKQPGFFDVVTYTGNGTAGHTINHSLGSTPGMIIFKRYDSALNWYVAHRYDLSKYLVLNQTAAAGSFAVVTATSDTTFTLPNDGSTNASGGSYVAYIFAHDAQDFGTDSDESIIKCGSYTGTGSAGNSINLGFEPQWLMIKQASGVNDWYMYDTMRGITTGGDDAVGLKANSSDAEGSSNHLSVTSTGFELEGIGGGYNGSGATYIYVAIRRPHKPAEEFAATDLFDAFKYKDNTLVQTDNPIQLTSDRQTGGPAVLTDMWWHALRGTTYPAGKSNSFFIGSRLQGAGKGMITNGTNAEPAGDASEMRGYDRMTGVEVGPNGTFYYYSTAAGNRDHISYYFRRAPGFFDVVAYTGTGSTLVLNHNLGVEPEFMIVKGRTINAGWHTYHKDVGNTKAVPLNSSGAASTSSFYWNNTSPTATQVTLGAFTHYNVSNQTGILYLFATVPGISKVGSYSGTGSNVDVDCGFTSGARFVLVKRTDSTGDWYVWDSARGIVAGNDGYLLLNSNAAEVTSTDYIDPLSSGFTITSTAPAALNASGGSYLFLAIA